MGLSLLIKYLDFCLVFFIVLVFGTISVLFFFPCFLCSFVCFSWGFCCFFFINLLREGGLKY